MELELRQKVAIVTGAARGLGQAMAEALYREGACVIQADVAFAENGLKAKGENRYECQVDVSQPGLVSAFIAAIESTLGRIDILVNNAGICPRRGLEEITPEEWDQVMQVNLKSVFMLCQRVLPGMKQRRYGKIVNIASAAGKIGGAQVGAHYAASKAGVICLTKSVAAHAAPFGVNVNAICPGIIDTRMTMGLPPEKLERYQAAIPLGRIGSALDVAQAVLFLASDVSGYITGEIMDVNGGFVMD
jgi:3-oxoacyl-[acyl-carrier protein] reductase